MLGRPSYYCTCDIRSVSEPSVRFDIGDCPIARFQWDKSVMAARER
jgi:hypothetical protein